MLSLSPVRVYVVMNCANALIRSSMYVILAVYYVVSVHMNPLQLGLDGTTLEVAYFLFHIPTGVFADMYGRRLSIVSGLVSCGACFTAEGLTGTFGSILLAEAVRGLGEAF